AEPKAIDGLGIELLRERNTRFDERLRADQFMFFKIPYPVLARSIFFTHFGKPRLLPVRLQPPPGTPRPPRRSGRASARAALLDHLISAQQNRQWHLKTERGGGLSVHDHLELGRKLHREIARLLAAQNAIDIGGGATKVVYPVDSVGEQT